MTIETFEEAQLLQSNINDYLKGTEFYDESTPSLVALISLSGNEYEVDIAVFPDTDMPPAEEQEKLIKGMSDILEGYQPSFVRTTEAGRIPQRGSRRFEALNPGMS
jgi:hypothetical protein